MGWRAEAFPDVWALARAYLSDCVSFSQKELDVLNGCIRARDVSALMRVASGLPAHSTLARAKELSQLTAFFKKNADFRDSCAQQNAGLSFHRAEKLCKITNKRIDYYSRHPERDAWAAIKARAQNIIQDVLGPLGELLDSMEELIRVTDGATSTHPKAASLPYLKMGKTIYATPRAVPLAHAFLAAKGFDPYAARIVQTNVNRVTTVPKNWTTDRTIACEPSGNLPFQLAIDAFLKVRLREKTGIDLSDQSRNQEGARQGSLDGTLATIDLSMASDTLSYNTVAELLPSPWFQLLDGLRCAAYSGVFGYGLYSKFSSMGNGFTFPLQTLIYYALGRAIGSVKVIVYGDDIVIESSLYHEYCALLKHFGFVINSGKSFFEGPFRESCGADFYEGTNIRAFYHKGHPKAPPEAMVIVNGLVTRCRPLGTMWTLLAKAVTTLNLLLVPSGAADSHGVRVPLCYCAVKHSGGHVLYKGWSSKQKTINRRGDVRTYLLWHLTKGHKKHNEQAPRLSSVLLPTVVGAQEDSGEFIYARAGTPDQSGRVLRLPHEWLGTGIKDPRTFVRMAGSGDRWVRLSALESSVVALPRVKYRKDFIVLDTQYSRPGPELWLWAEFLSAYAGRNL